MGSSPVSISVFLDKRRPRKDGRYPLKIRVYHGYDTRLYPLNLHATREEFDSAYFSQKPTDKNLRVLKEKVVTEEAKALEAAKDLEPFSFDLFEKRLQRPGVNRLDVLACYSETVEQLTQDDRITTASNYRLAMRSLGKFLKAKHLNEHKLFFSKVTPAFLQDYERWMLAEGRNRTTVSIYLRTLRTLFNQLITEGKLPRESYPFGKRKYQIPAGRNIKKALKKSELKRLWEHPVPEGSEMERARDFFFFSYLSNGINMRDIAELRNKDLQATHFSFVRTKTRNTSKTDIKPILVPVTSVSMSIIEKYRSHRNGKEDYLFPILQEAANEKERVRRVQAFTRFVNQHIKRLAKLAGVTTDISTYWARHSYTTIAVQNGASLEFIQESLGHASLTTTMNYWKGFEDNAKRHVAEKLMDF